MNIQYLNFGNIEIRRSEENNPDDNVFEVVKKIVCEGGRLRYPGLIALFKMSGQDVTFYGKGDELETLKGNDARDFSKLLFTLGKEYKVSFSSGENSGCPGAQEEARINGEWDEETTGKYPTGTQAKDGMKNDFSDDKLRWDLLPFPEIEDIVRVYHFGAKKYKPESWKELPDGFERYRAALLRHLAAYMNGERNDRESGLNHLSQVAWNAIALLWYDKHGKGLINNEETK